MFVDFQSLFHSGAGVEVRQRCATYITSLGEPKLSSVHKNSRQCFIGSPVLILSSCVCVSTPRMHPQVLSNAILKTGN